MRVLAVGAHPDDVEIGCGASLLAHQARGDEVTLLVMTTGESGPQVGRSRIREQEDAARLLGARLLWGGFPDGAIPQDRSSIEVIEDAITRTGAEIVYVHAPDDTHQDHRATAVATLSAARKLARVLHYESPSTTQFAPSVFIDVERFIGDKLEVLRAHTSQVLGSRMVDLEALEAQARYRGFGARIRFAEAFQPSRFVWELEVPPVGAAALADRLELDRTA